MMTVFEFAIYRHARGLMTPAELEDAEFYARMADNHKDREARAALKNLCLEVVRRDVLRAAEREKRKHAEKPISG